MAYVSRDPFARTELHRERVVAGKQASDGGLTYDTWLQDSAAYERFAGLDGLTEEESDAVARELERRTEERIERDAESDGGRPGAD